MSSTFDAFGAAIRDGCDPHRAAMRTFTGKMAARNGFTRVRIVSMTQKKVVVEFFR